MTAPTGLSPLSPTFPDRSASSPLPKCRPTTPNSKLSGLGCSAFARHYSQNRLFSSRYLDVSVPPVPSACAVTRCNPRRISPFGHRRLVRLHTPHRRFSQYATSFIGTGCQDIHHVPLLTSSRMIRRGSSSRYELSSNVCSGFAKLPNA